MQIEWFGYTLAINISYNANRVVLVTHWQSIQVIMQIEWFGYTLAIHLSYNANIVVLVTHWQYI